MRRLNQFALGAVCVLSLVIVPVHAQQKGNQLPSDRKCLTVVEPCNPASCNYDPQQCKEMRDHTNKAPSISLSRDTEKQAIYITQDDITVTSTLPVSLGENDTVSVTFHDKAIAVLSPQEILTIAKQRVPSSYGHQETTLSATEDMITYTSSFFKEVRLLNLFVLKPRYTVTINAQTQAIISNSASWYAFLFR